VQNRDIEQSASETRRSLIEAAGEVVAEKGFHLATTREICQKAGANVAAIHYYFGSKEGLYRALLLEADGFLAGALPDALTLHKGPRERRLRAFVDWMLGQWLTGDEPDWRWKIIEQVGIGSTPAIDAFINTRIKPVLAALDDICREFLDQSADPWQVRLSARSIVGQCMYYRRMQSHIRITDERSFTPEGRRALIEHIVQFSIDGLKAQARRLKLKRRPARGRPVTLERAAMI
jgi:AcrR family transcriptional regulator